MAPERVYEISEAAPLLRVTENWLKVNARLHGWGTKLGRKRLFTEAHLAEILASGVERPTRVEHPRAPRIKAAKSHMPEALSTDRAVTPLRARPEAARSYGRTPWPA